MPQARLRPAKKSIPKKKRPQTKSEETLKPKRIIKIPSSLWILYVISVPLFSVLIAFLILSSCTLSFSNFDTHGKSSDLLDEEQEASPKISGTLTHPSFGF